MKYLILAFAFAAVLVSLVTGKQTGDGPHPPIPTYSLFQSSTAGNVVIGGRCLDCSPPVAEKVIVDGQLHSVGKPGQGTVYINSPGAYPGALDGPARGPAGKPSLLGGGNGGSQYPEGFSGRVPGNTYLHNTDCVGCSISGGGD